MNDRTLHDALLLVSRLEEKGGDVRGLFRRDPDVQREIHSYLDDVSWLAGRPMIEPSLQAEAFARASLLSAVNRGKSRAGFLRSRRRAAGAAATVALLVSAAIGGQVAVAGIPQPVNQMWITVSMAFNAAEGESLATPALSDTDDAVYTSTGSAEPDGQ